MTAHIQCTCLMPVDSTFWHMQVQNATSLPGYRQAQVHVCDRYGCAHNLQYQKYSEQRNKAHCGVHECAPCLGTRTTVGAPGVYGSSPLRSPFAWRSSALRPQASKDPLPCGGRVSNCTGGHSEGHSCTALSPLDPPEKYLSSWLAQSYIDYANADHDSGGRRPSTTPSKQAPWKAPRAFLFT